MGLFSQFNIKNMTLSFVVLEEDTLPALTDAYLDKYAHSGCRKTCLDAFRLFVGNASSTATLWLVKKGNQLVFHISLSLFPTNPDTHGHVAAVEILPYAGGLLRAYENELTDFIKEKIQYHNFRYIYLRMQAGEKYMREKLLAADIPVLENQNLASLSNLSPPE